MTFRTTVLCVLLGSAMPLCAQTYYDDFGGAGGIDARRWYTVEPSTLAQTGGFLQVRVPAGQIGDDLETTYGFDGDFDLQLDFQGLSGTGGVWLGVYDGDPTRAPADFWIGVFSSATGQIVETESQTTPEGTVTAGTLRIHLSGGAIKTLTASYRPSGSSAWTVLATQTNGYSPVVQAWIETDGGAQSFAVDVDGLRSEGPQVQFPAPPLPAPYAVGNRCYVFDARAGGFPFVGARTFGLGARNAAPGAPVWIMLGRSHTIWAGTPLPLGLWFLGDPSCYLNVSPDFILPAGIAGSSGVLPLLLRIPNAPALRGGSLAGQFIALDAGTAIGLSFSNGVTFTIL